MSEGDKSTILEGIRIVENTVWGAGGIATKMLGELGAEVIKVEKPGGGPELGQDKLMGIEMKKKVDGQVIIVDPTSPNRKRITVDLTKEKGREVMYRLIEKSDAFIQNLGPGKVVELGIDYQTVSQYNPIIMSLNVLSAEVLNATVSFPEGIAGR